MAKYSYEFKKEAVLTYLNGEGGQSYLMKKYGISAKKRLQECISSYEQFRDEGLIRSRKNEKFSFEYKLHVVKLYLTIELSYQELAIQEKLRNPSLITKWVNDFRIGGPEALRPKKKGRKKTLNAPSKKTDIQPVKVNPINTSAELIKKLEDELLKLRIENAYLKDLRRLRLEYLDAEKPFIAFLL
ncbi:transposase [Anaerotignum sp.]|uniref:transposase n=1 Tax=Anaerotignum sp. TaxID=2039241 RepID=UPI00271541DB|nr:transposase [Anaerotignum sp.]